MADLLKGLKVRLEPTPEEYAEGRRVRQKKEIEVAKQASAAEMILEEHARKDREIPNDLDVSPGQMIMELEKRRISEEQAILGNEGES